MRKPIIALLAGLFLLLPVNAQRTYRYQMGQLSNNRFQAICEDESGFIWIGTENGLNRYDGYNFYKFFHDNNDSLSLMSNYIRSLYSDEDGTLWIGTNRGIQYLRPSDKRFHTVSFPGDRLPYIQQITKLSDGRIWVAAPGDGLYWIDPENPVQVNGISSLNNYAPAQGIFRGFVEDQEGTIWLGTANGVLLYDPRNDKITEFSADVISGDITGLIMNENGDIFISTHNHVYMWSTFRRRLSRITPDEGIWEITHLFQDRDGVKVSLRGKGLLYLTDDLHLEQYLLKPNDPSLEKLDVSAMYMDRAGNNWIGCFLSELILVTKDRNEFEYWKFSDYQEDISGTVTAMAVDSENRLWIGYNNNGVTCMSSNGRVIRVGYNAPYISCLFRDSKNRIWAGCPNRGLALLNTQSGYFEMVLSNEYSNVSSIAEDNKGRIYYSELGTGFSRLNPVDMKTEVYGDFAKSSRKGRSLNNDWIHIMLVDSWNRLWIGHDNGADCFDIDRSEFIDNDKLSQAMGTSGCTCILEEREGIIWFGTTKGIIVYNMTNGVATLLNTAKGLSNNDIRGMVKDNDGYIWASTPGGVNRINPDDYEISRFFTEEKAFNGVSAFSVVDDRAYFASNSGITAFYPYRIFTESTVNKVVMTGFYLNGQPITSESLSGGKLISEKPLNVSDQFRLAYRDNSFTLEFSSLNYGDEQSLIYEYSMTPGGGEWVSNPAGVNRLSFSQLGYGRYTLSVRARLNDIVSPPRTYMIKIEAPWYASSVAMVVYILLMLALLSVIFRTRRRTRQREMDEAKFQSFINVAHEICAPMTMVISPLEDMMQNSTIPADVQSNLRQMHKSSTRILSLINQLLDMRKFDEGQMQLHYAETDLINFLMGPFELYTQAAEKRNIDFTFNHSMAEQTVWIDRDSIDKVMMNLLSNAFKYTNDGGKIEMNVEVGTDDHEKGPLHNYVEVSISDTGIGLDKDDIERIFQRFYRADNKLTSVTMGMGIGLNYSQMLVRMHHGTIKADNRKDGQSGSVFSFRLPLGNSHIPAEDIVDTDQIARPQLERNRAGLDIDEPTDESRFKGNFKVLVVDDDDSMLDYLSDSLKHSYKIITARNGKEGLKYAVSQMPDLIITDVVMPEMDGIQLVKALKGNSLVSHIPVIMLSGKNKLQDRMLGLDTGADSYLPKPFYMSELKALMSNLISNRLIVKGKFSGQQEQAENVAEVQFESSDEQFMKRVMEIVNANISNSDFNITQMVDEVGMSRTQLHRKLKELTGFSAARFMQNIRMQQAMKLLKEKRVNVSQIAYSVGFASQTHFSTTFKQYYGVSPTEYIRQLEADESGK